MTKHLITVACTLGLLSGDLAAQNSLTKEEYLDAIRQEIKELNVDSASRPANVSREEFDERLRRTNPSSYYLMQNLPIGEQDGLYGEYRESGDLARIRERIMELTRSH